MTNEFFVQFMVFQGTTSVHELEILFHYSWQSIWVNRTTRVPQMGLLCELEARMAVCLMTHHIHHRAPPVT